MIRVLLADDHGVIRDGLGRLIGGLEDVELVGTAADGADAIEKAEQLQPDVVVMDLDMPRVDGIEATRKILAQQQTNVLVLTAFSDRARILGALEAGACGYLLKDAASEDVAEGIRAAARGESPLDPRAARTVLSSARAEPDPLAGLSQREREVLDALVEGPPEQADRAPAGDQREDRQVAPDAHLPRARRDRPHAGRAVGGASRSGPKVSLSPGPRRWHRSAHDASPPPAVARSCCSRAVAAASRPPRSASRSICAATGRRSRPRSA